MLFGFLLVVLSVKNLPLSPSLGKVALLGGNLLTHKLVYHRISLNFFGDDSHHLEANNVRVLL
jgi:hypothetical protein